MKKKNYISYVCTKLILWLIISALLTLGFGGLSYIEYDRYVNGLKNGQDEGNLTYYILSRYLSCALRDDPRINLYKSNMKVVPDYEFFAKVNDDGSLDTIYKTDYDSVYCRTDVWSADSSFEAELNTAENLPIYQYNDDETWSFYIDYVTENEEIYTFSSDLAETKMKYKSDFCEWLDDYVAQFENDIRKPLKPLYRYNEYRLTSDHPKKVFEEKFCDVRMVGVQPQKLYAVNRYYKCLNKPEIKDYINRSYELKRLQNTHVLFADKVIPWLNPNKTDAEGSSFIKTIVARYTDLYDDDIKMDQFDDPSILVLNDKKYGAGELKEDEVVYTIPSVCQKPEKLFSNYKNILEPEKINTKNVLFVYDSIFESDDKEANLLMDYKFDARFSNNYSYNFGYLMQYGLIRTAEGYYYYAFATPMAEFWETEGIIISVFFLIIFAAGFVLINLLSIFPFIRYVDKYNNTVFKTGLIDALAHNLKTPMQIISVNAENIKDTDSSEEKDDLADIILSQTDSVNNMVERILKAADRKAVKTVFETREVVEQMAKKIGVEIVINGTHKIRADREFFEQAIYNLIDNAGKYRSDGDILVDINRNGIEIINQSGSEGFTPGAGIAIADRFLIQNGMSLKVKLKGGRFIADIRF